MALALSGGPDSTALLHLLLDWARAQDRTVTALIVDHGLRAGSDAEAHQVAASARAAGAAASVLRWPGPKPATGIQAAARAARYALMLDWCRETGVGALFLGHHLDDQAVTVLMRLKAGSGIDGLGAMRTNSQRDGIRLIRPLLEVRKAELTGWLDARAIAYVSDPTNRSPDHERNRLNAWLNARPPGERLPERLARLARRSARASAALEELTDRAQAALVTPGTAAGYKIERTGWEALSDEIALRLIARLVARVAGRKPGLSTLEDALARLPSQRRVTLAGVEIALKPDRIRIVMAPARRKT
ncbi:tRNA lysidine(34) synthetase TilS [Minwuia sp.]|uniref:tRNA lysidine(34) synthetase TilS n=1 Tax=Minwuia sp. TaxID=2493630 RepID=UPI003A8D1888